MATHMTLGQRVRAIRLKKGMSQVELANGICTPSMISQIESDRANPSHRMLVRLAERLDTSLQTFLTDVELNLNFFGQYRMAQTMMKSGEHFLAIPLLEELLSTPRHEISWPSISFDLAISYFFADRLKLAQELFEQLREHFVMAQDREKLTETLFWIGMIEFTEKRYHLAIYYFQKAGDELGKIEPTDFELKANVLYRLAQSHESLGQIYEAIEFFDAAGEALKEMNDLRGLATLYGSTAEAYAKIGKYEKSVQFSEKAISLYDALELLLQQAKIVMHAGVVKYKMGDRERAVELLEDAMQRLKLYGTSDDVSLAFVELAKIKLDQGHIDQAEELCQTAIEHPSSIHFYQGDIKRLKGKIALARRNQEDAIQLLWGAAECFKQENKFTEWSCTMEDLANIYKASSDLESAVGILTCIRTTTREKLQERGIAL